MTANHKKHQDHMSLKHSAQTATVAVN